jgi:hypothetical protein
MRECPVRRHLVRRHLVRRFLVMIKKDLIPADEYMER